MAIAILDIRWPLLFFPEKDFIYNYVHIVHKWTKNHFGKLNFFFKISVHRTSNPALSCGCKTRKTMIMPH